MEVVAGFQKICLSEIASMPTETYCDFFNKAHGYKEDTTNPEKVLLHLKDTPFLDVVTIVWDDGTESPGWKN